MRLVESFQVTRPGTSRERRPSPELVRIMDGARNAVIRTALELIAKGVAGDPAAVAAAALQMSEKIPCARSLIWIDYEDGVPLGVADQVQSAAVPRSGAGQVNARHPSPGVVTGKTLDQPLGGNVILNEAPVGKADGQAKYIHGSIPGDSGVGQVPADGDTSAGASSSTGTEGQVKS